MVKKESDNPTIGIIITILITIFPFTQIILLTLMGGLTYILTIPFVATNKSDVIEISSLVVNVVLTTLGLVTFYFANGFWVKIVSTLLIMGSGQMLMLFLSQEFNEGDNYLLGWLTVSGIPILIILTLGLVKHYVINRKTGSVG
jgi:hypothetical protein